jgi:phospholipid/cholesterol/gamma-HCH transport system ATP-binding protein
MITIRNLKKSFNSTPVLDNLNLEVHNKEILVILGRCGCGKSVLLKHIMGLIKADSGTIDIDGTRISDLSESQLYKTICSRMGMLFQNSALFDSMTIEENISLFLTEHSKLSRKEIKKKALEALEMVDLVGCEKKMPSELSGGMKKKAALARLIIYRPSIILYDEPTTGFDAITSMQISNLIVQMQKELQSTTIVVTHDILSALQIANRLALMEDGVINYIDTPKAFMKINHPTINFLKNILSTKT